MKVKSRTRTAAVRIDVKKCIGCWDCIVSCPKEVIAKVGFLWHKHIIIKKPEACIGCYKCIKACNHGVFKQLE